MKTKEGNGDALPAAINGQKDGLSVTHVKSRFAMLQAQRAQLPIAKGV